MITQLRMKNFKCYKDCTIKFNNFNVFCGPNSSGKSSINQAILFLLQNNHGNINNLITNGEYVHFDEFEEIKNDEISPSKHVSIELVGSEKQRCYLEIKKSEKNNYIECVKNVNDFRLQGEKNIFYLSADRIGPLDVYDKYNGSEIGFQGEYAVGFIAKNKDNVIDEKFAFYKSPTRDYTFLKEINYWLKEIIGEKINVNDLDRTDKTRATYSKESKILQVRNKNTGSGLSYVISIISMVLSISIKNKEEMPTFIIENPEIHLHPIAQIKLMKFLMFMSRHAQFIIETHSDHIIKHVLERKDGQLIKLSNYEPVYYKAKSRKILPRITLGEIKWTAFDIPTIDFHVELYSYLQEKYSISNINKLDDEIRDTEAFKKNKKIYETRCRRFRNHYGAMSDFETLPTYLRNVIDHPKKIKTDEPKRKKYRKTEEEFEKALKLSILFMIDIIKENSW